MSIKLETKKRLLKYYQGQFFKLLNIYENKDENGRKFALKFRGELVHLPRQIKELSDNHYFNVIIAKLDTVIEKMNLEEDHHELVKNHTFEACKLFDDIGSDLR